MVLMPLLLYKIIKPEVTEMPEAPAEARKSLAGARPADPRPEDRRRSRSSAWWRCGARRRRSNIDPTAIAFLGFGVLLATGVLTLGDIAKEGDVLATFIWFAALFTMSAQLNELGFMEFLGGRLVMRLEGLTPVVAGRDPGRGVRGAPLPLRQPDRPAARALRRLPGRRRQARRVGAACSRSSSSSRRNYFAAMAPQASSANLLFVGSGYLTQGELYKLGAMHTLFCVVIYLVIGTPWLLLVTR